MDSRFGLPIDTILDASYRIERVVGSGGFGITYEAEDINLATRVAIKEYYPFDFGDRDDAMSVKPKSDRHRQTFDWGRSNFLQEARTLARFEHPSIVRVTRVFEANSTAYMVMGFERGQSLEDWLGALGRFPTQAELDGIVAPILSALEMLHAADFLHRDIAPDNIIVRADGSPVLLDFGSARQAVAQMSRKLTGIVKAGYSPPELYSSNSRLQGPWSDLYAFGGVLYRAVTGLPPDEATLRISDDHMPSAAATAKQGQYRRGFLNGIDACLKVRHAERPRSVALLRPMLAGGGVPKTRLERPDRLSDPANRSPRVQGLAEASRRSRLLLQQVQTSARTRWLLARQRLGQLSERARRSLRLERLPQARERAGQMLGRFVAACTRTGRQLGHLAKTASARAAQSLSLQYGRLRRIPNQAIRRLQLERIKQAAALPAQWAARRWMMIAMIVAIIGSAYGIHASWPPPLDDGDARRKVEVQRRAEEDQAAQARADAEARALAEAQAKREEEARSLEARALQEAEAKRQADAAAAAASARPKSDPQAEDRRVAAVALNADERTVLVKRIQEMLKARRCYEGAVNGSSREAQIGLDRFVEGAHRKGLEKPVRIELAKATASDFNAWLQEAGEVKSDICPAARSRPPERSRRDPPSSSSGGGGGGGGGGSIQGVR